MPESHTRTRVFLGEYFWAPAFKHSYGSNDDRDAWTSGDRFALPCEVLVTTDEYMQERAGYDCSIEDTISMYLPAKWIVDKMKLSWRGVDGCFFDPSGKMIAQDPTTRVPGPGALLVEKESFGAFIESQGCRLVWTLLAEKDVHSGFGRNENWPGRMELSACIRMGKSRVEGTGTAYWVTTGPKHEVLAKFDIQHYA